MKQKKWWNADEGSLGATRKTETSLTYLRYMHTKITVDAGTFYTYKNTEI